ncbi:hypothetical protein BDV06DRAFT_202550 [Aspergillus oleicola]
MYTPTRPHTFLPHSKPRRSIAVSTFAHQHPNLPSSCRDSSSIKIYRSYTQTIPSASYIQPSTLNSLDQIYRRPTTQKKKKRKEKEKALRLHRLTCHPCHCHCHSQILDIESCTQLCSQR